MNSLAKAPQLLSCERLHQQSDVISDTLKLANVIPTLRVSHLMGLASVPDVLLIQMNPTSSLCGRAEMLIGMCC